MMPKTLVLFLLLELLVACDAAERSTQPVAASAKATDSEMPSAGARDPLPLQKPPLGRWRLADPAELDSVVLFLSHILIRHAELSGSKVPFNHVNWRMELPAASRSRREAWAHAEAIAEQARRQPERFAELAGEFSEDAVTRDSGGSLGGIVAPMFSRWPQVLDAVAETPVGAVSRVVETQFGFHVFLRRRPPADLLVSGEHIVIAHDEAPWIKTTAAGPVPSRSRAEALAVAKQIFDQARQAPDQFHAQAERHSDQQDRVRGGGFGTWSTWEPSAIPREIETLAGVAIGEVAPPLDTAIGYQVLKRVETRPQHLRAMSRLELRFDDSQPDSAPTSRASVLAEARSLIRSIADDPARLAQAHEHYCCYSLTPILPGRFAPAVEAALEGLQVGEVGADPILYAGMMYLIIQRVDPARLPTPPSARFELPAPEQVDLGYLVRSRAPALLERELQQLGDEACARLDLPSSLADPLRRLHEEPANLASIKRAQRLSHVQRLQAKVRELLGSERYAQYEAIAMQHFEQFAFHSGRWAASASDTVAKMGAFVQSPREPSAAMAR
jgi:hypothetical protein